MSDSRLGHSMRLGVVLALLSSSALVRPVGLAPQLLPALASQLTHRYDFATHDAPERAERRAASRVVDNWNAATERLPSRTAVDPLHALERPAAAGNVYNYDGPIEKAPTRFIAAGSRGAARPSDGLDLAARVQARSPFAPLRLAAEEPSAGSRLVVGGGRAAGFPETSGISLNVDAGALPHIVGGHRCHTIPCGILQPSLLRESAVPGVHRENISVLGEAARLLRPGGELIIETGFRARAAQIIAELERLGFTNIFKEEPIFLRITATYGSP